MHIAIIGAGAFIIFVVIGGLLMAAVVLEQRTRRHMAAAAPASVPAEMAVEASSPETSVASGPKAKAMAAASGRS
jgi:hypothetical protein